ncbi:MAG: tetratricopeptide repeat protein [Candidatus Omnitrophota bacterium]
MDKLLTIRLLLDDALTYHDSKKAGALAIKGLKAAQNKESLGEVNYFKGQLEMLNENFKKAIEYFDRAITFNPKDGASYNDRALCMIELGIIDDALEYFERGIKAEPDFATIHHNKGWLLNKIGRHSDAIRCFKTALAFDPKRPVTYENLADTLYNIGDIRGARGAYKKAIKILPQRYKYIRRQLSKEIKALTYQTEKKSREKR